MGKVVDTGDTDFDVTTKSDEWVLAASDEKNVIKIKTVRNMTKTSPK